MRPGHRAWLLALALLLAGCGGGGGWHLKDITGVVPDLEFRLTDDSGRKVSAADYRGQAVMLFFGYTNCPDVCPTTLAKLVGGAEATGRGGAARARAVRHGRSQARHARSVLH